MSAPRPRSPRFLALDLLERGAGFLDRLPLLLNAPLPPAPRGASAPRDEAPSDPAAPPPAGASAWDLARHWSARGEAERAIEAGIRAAQGSLRQGDATTAGERFAFALRHLGKRDPRRGALRRRLAEALDDAGLHLDAARAFGAAIRISDTKAERADLMTRQAEALVEGGRFRRARDAAKTVRALVRGTRQRDVHARCRRVHGIACARIGALDEARASLQDALERFEKLGDAPAQIAKTRCALGLVLWRLGDESASERLREALEACDRAGATEPALDCVAALAVIDATAGRGHRAERWLEMLRERSDGQDWRIELVTGRLATAYLARGRVEPALAFGRQNLQAAEAIGDPEHVLAASCRLAELSRRCGRSDRAEALLRDALGRVDAETPEALTAVARVLLASAMLESPSTEPDTPRLLLERALVTLRGCDQGWALFPGLVVELERLESTGSESAETAACELEARAERESEDLDVELRIRVLLARSRLRARRGDAEAARGPAERAVELGAAAGRPLCEISARVALRAALSRHGQREAASRCLDAARSLLDTLAQAIGDEKLREDLLGRRELRALRRTPSFEVGADRRLTALYEMIRVLNSETDPEALLETILDMALQAVRAERGLILLRESPSAPFDVKLARNLDSDAETEVGSFSRGVVTQAGAGDSLLVIDAGRDERFRDLRSISVFGIRSLMCVPLRSGKTVTGAVYLDSRNEAGLFTREDLRFLRAFAEQATLALENVRRRAELERANRRLRASAQERVRFGSLVGRAPSMQRIFDLIERFAASDLPVLIRGESGTGKELVARAIHGQGPRRRKVFLSENCAAIPDSLLESELFGHVKGAFTGADRDRAGLFAQADGGTLFLDEVGEMSGAMQAKLLRAIQAGEIRPVGSNEAFKVDVRLLAATHRDLEADQAAGRFREDLYYRLQVLVAHLPPLRERAEDIRLLCDHMLERISRERGKGLIHLAPEVLERFERYSWPGNVRQLENALQRLALLAGETTVRLEHVRMDDGLRAALLAGEVAAEAPLSLSASERERIEAALSESGGNREQAARLLGISRATIYRKIKVHGII
jgi:Nif-specific regulatory protein